MSTLFEVLVMHWLKITGSQSESYGAGIPPIGATAAAVAIFYRQQ